MIPRVTCGSRCRNTCLEQGNARSSCLPGGYTFVMSTALAHETVAVATLWAVRELILHGQLKAGEPVRREWLSDRLGVSRIPAGRPCGSLRPKDS